MSAMNQSAAISNQVLANGLKGYSTEAIKSAIAQSTLNEEQIKAILIEKGFEGQILETTTAELTQATATNALSASQTGATASTLGLGTAIKGLGASIKALALAHPVLTAIAAAGITIYGAVKGFDALTVSMDEAIEKTKSSKQELDQLTSEISDLNNELETTKNRIDELVEKANSGSISLAEEEELNKLKEQNSELQREIALKEKLAEMDAKEVADNAANSITYKTDDDHWDNEYNATDRIDKLQSYIDSANYYQDKISEVNKQILDIEESATDNTYKNDSAYKSLISQQQKYQKELQKTEGLISSTYNELSVEDDGLYYNGKAVEGYEGLVGRLDAVYRNVESYLNGGNIEDATEKYIGTIRSKLVESGLSEEVSKIVAEGFSAEELESIMNADSIDWSQCLGLDDAIAVIENIRGQLASITVSKSDASFNLTDYKDQIDGIQSNISTLRSAMDSLNQGTLDESAVIDLMQEFPSLIPYIDMTAEGFGNLSEGLNALILQQPDSLIESLEELKLSLETDEERANVDALIESLRNMASYGFEDYVKQVDNVKSSISSLRSALDSLNQGTMEESDVLELARQFPELLPYIDMAADGFGNLSEGLSRLIQQQPEMLINNLQAFKETLNTDAERAQIDMLIDSLQRLSSYGDSGIEAYATTVGDTWNDTANVIEGVTTQFENLAKVQEAVADGLTMSADAAAELAKMYPEILNHAQVTADGQITLNEEVVNSILDGDKSIIDAQIAKLEADKAVLVGKKQYAEAQLEIVRQVGEGEGKRYCPLPQQCGS